MIVVFALILAGSSSPSSSFSSSSSSVEAFSSVLQPTLCKATTTSRTTTTSSSSLLAYYDAGAPSDYDSEDLTKKKNVQVDTNRDDATIRDALKRELLLLASVTNRGECATKDEQNIMIDLVNQLEALNPTAEPAFKCEGEWNLCLSSTELFRSSPFFQSLRVAVGDENKQIADNGFELHDRATTGSRIGRVRQTIDESRMVSEVELEVGILPGLPFRIKGTVVTVANMKVVSSETLDLEVVNTQVTGSNVPLLNQFLDDLKFELPVGDIYKTLRGDVPVVKMKVGYRSTGWRAVRVLLPMSYGVLLFASTSD